MNSHLRGEPTSQDPTAGAFQPDQGPDSDHCPRPPHVAPQVTYTEGQAPGCPHTQTSRHTADGYLGRC